jgi:hypothetical protein
MRLSAKRYDRSGRGVVVSRQSVVSIRKVGLERAQRFAGEAFGHEEMGPLPRLASAPRFQPWAIWGFASLALGLALTALALR